jgi:peptidoglycan/LPS O-acetylase OafA/YrhL
MFIAATAQTQWKSPRLLAPLLKIGQYSYEVYLTHMFVVFALFDLFLSAGKRLSLVPVFFVATILIAGLLGAAVSSLYSEPMNRFLRRSARRDGGQPPTIDESANSRARDTSD